MVKKYLEFIKENYDGEIIKVKDLTELESTLESYGVDYKSWGKGYAKTTEHLMRELEAGECFLKVIDGNLVRFSEFVGISITYVDLKLKEDYQEFKDGRVRRRESVNSVSEKMISGENPRMAAVRGVEEELGVEVNPNQLMKVISDTEYQKRNYNAKLQSYPGLSNMHKQHLFTCEFLENQYKPEGYTEIQRDKSTFFKWIPK